MADVPAPKPTVLETPDLDSDAVENEFSLFNRLSDHDAATAGGVGGGGSWLRGESAGSAGDHLPIIPEIKNIRKPGPLVLMPEGTFVTNEKMGGIMEPTGKALPVIDVTGEPREPLPPSKPPVKRVTGN